MRRVGLLEKLRNKRGGSTLFEIVISLGLITFILFYPIATFTLTHKENLLEDVLTVSMQMVSVEGGLTDRAEDLIYQNLEAKRLIPQGESESPTVRSKVRIVCNADARGGNTANLVYRDDADPTLSIQILYPADNEVNFINGLSSLLGAKGASLPYKITNSGQVEWYYNLNGYILSERIDYDSYGSNLGG